MAAVAVILGGMVGFFSALISMIAFNASWFLALGIWSLFGFAVALVLITLAVTPKADMADIAAEHA